MTDNITTSTSPTTTSYSYTYPSKSPYQAEKGWECPRCGHINAPWVRQCDCSRNNFTTTYANSAVKEDLWKQYAQCDSDTFRIHPDCLTSIGGSDYYDKIAGTYCNIIKNGCNCKEK